MFRLPARISLFFFLGTAILSLAPTGPLSGQTPKFDPKKKDKAGFAITPEMIEIAPGAPLSSRTPVTAPAQLKGVKSWTIETKQHRWAATCMAVSPDGTLLATGGYDGVVRIWDPHTGKFVRALVGHESYVYGLSWSPDGQYLASGGAFDASARIWNPKTGQLVRVLAGHKDYVSVVAFSGDGKTLAVGGGASGFVTFWDLNTVKKQTTIENGVAIYQLSWSPDNRKIVCSCNKNSAAMWEVNLGKLLKTFVLPGGDAYSSSWTPDGKLLATGGATSVIIWDSSTYEAVHTLKVGGSSLAYSPDGNTLAHVTTAGAVQFWDASKFKDKEPKIAPTATTLSASSLIWPKESKSVFAFSGTSVSSWNVAENKLERTFNVAQTNTILWTQARPLIADMDTVTPTLWDSPSGKLLAKLEGHKGAVTTARWSRDGKHILTGSTDKTAKIWDASGKATRTLEGHEGAVNAVAWGPEGRMATASDKMVRVWSAGDKPQELAHHTHPVMGLAWSRDGRMLVSASDDRSVILWNLDTGKPLKQIDGVTDLQTVALSPDGKMVAAGGTDHVLRIWSIPAGKLLHSFSSLGSPPNVSAIAWSPDSTMVAGGRGNHTMQVWNLKTDALAYNVATMAPVKAVSWSADGKTIVTSTLDRAIRFWEADNGKLRGTLVYDGKQVAAIGADGHSRAPNEDSELIAVVFTEKGVQETMTPKALAKLGFKNVGAVKLLGN
jgi:WD40 repeat protein